MRPSRVLCALAACAVLAGCAERSDDAATPTSSEQDWRNASYTLTCDGVVPQGFSATLRDGEAQVPDATG